MGANSQDDAVALAGLLSYTRTGFHSDSLALLSSAKSRGLIDEQAQQGELAHILPFAPVSEQIQLATMLRSTGNSYAAEVVAMNFADPALVASLGEDTRGVLSAFLRSTEPSFGPALG